MATSKNKSYQFKIPDSLVNSTITDLKNCDLGQQSLSFLVHCVDCLATLTTIIFSLFFLA